MSTEKTETPTETPYASNDVPVKQGHSCCGCCCDVKRAVIIVDIIAVVFAIIAMFGLIAYTSAVNDVDDDHMQQVIEASKTMPLGVIFAMVIVQAVCFGLGIFGAIKYNFILVAIAGAVHAISVVFALINGVIPDAVMYAFFCYPHVMLYMEIKAGIMSEQNYHNEKQSCCCV